MGRRLLACSLGAALALVGSCTSSAVEPPRAPILFGAYVRPAPGETPEQAVRALESRIGRPLGGVRVYARWDDPWPTAFDTWLRDTGHTLVLSLRAVTADGRPVPWASIAQARPGSPIYSQIAAWATRVRRFGAHVYFVFHHEPETEASVANGDPPDFVGAWRKVVAVFRAQGATNAEFVWTMTQYAFVRSDARAAPAWYPGDAYVDDLGLDLYNFAACRPGHVVSWRPLSEMLRPFLRFADEHPSKGVLLTEWGSVERPGDLGAKAAWIGQAARTLAEPPWRDRVRAVLYWDAPSDTYAGCRYGVDTSPEALRAFASMGAREAFGGGSALGLGFLGAAAG